MVHLNHMRPSTDELGEVSLWPWTAKVPRPFPRTSAIKEICTASVVRGDHASNTASCEHSEQTKHCRWLYILYCDDPILVFNTTLIIQLFWMSSFTRGSTATHKPTPTATPRPAPAPPPRLRGVQRYVSIQYCTTQASGSTYAGGPSQGQ